MGRVNNCCIIRLYLGTGLIIGLSGAAAAADTVGWRNDGTGHFPAADPPTRWERKAQTILWGMRCQSAKPAPGDESSAERAEAVSPQTGLMSEWLVLGPFPVADADKALGEALLPDEAGAQPDEGQKVGGLAWTKARASEPEVHFAEVVPDFPKADNQAAYAHTYLYSKEAGKLAVWTGSHEKGIKVWFNGKPVYEAKDRADGNGRVRHVLEFKTGWNRLLFKVTHADRGFSFNTWLAPAHPLAYETRNIAYLTRLPAESVASPVLVGEKVFVTSDPDELICLDKHSGKILWIGTTTLYDAAAPEEQARARAAAEPLLARLKSLNDEFIRHANAGISRTGPPTDGRVVDRKVLDERREIQQKLGELMRRVDKKKFREPYKQNYGTCSPTPASDGASVFVSFMSGTTACYDLDGRRKWAAFENHGNEEHGNHYSPLLCSGVAGAPRASDLKPDRLIVCMNRDVHALDAAAGKVLWRAEVHYASCNSPVLARVPGRDGRGGGDMIVAGDGTFLRASDGQTLGNYGALGQPVATGVVSGGILFAPNANGLYALRLPDTLDPLPQTDKNEPDPRTAKPERLFFHKLNDKELEAEFGMPVTFAGGFVASPLVADGLVYLVSEGGFLLALDATTGQRVYGLRLPLHPRVIYVSHPGVAASPALAGGHVYLSDNSGTTLVLERGRQFKLLASNPLENILNPNDWGEQQEQVLASPAFDEDSIYLRGPKYLYCIRK